MIRRANQRDADAVAHLWAALLASQAALDDRVAPSADAVVRWRNDFSDWLKSESRRLFVAPVDDDVRGFLTAERWYPIPIYEGGGEIYLSELYVDPSCRRRGIGRSLVRAAAEWASDVGAARMRAGVLAANADAQAFWERIGGKPLSLTYTMGVAPREGTERTRTTLGFR